MLKSSLEVLLRYHIQKAKHVFWEVPVTFDHQRGAIPCTKHRSGRLPDLATFMFQFIKQVHSVI